ncbi:Trafficking kinesin-binding protein 1 [Aphelenchoides bicaudatus]|nr:Trafficking kinesin-binding protein 1 [Aphelenchoides bicaudatus]
MAAAQQAGDHDTSQFFVIGQKRQDDSAFMENLEFEKRIREKERDLELAAKIGKTLLDQNRELQERNEFLEESLNTSTDAVNQLQYQLQQRSALLNAFAEYDDQNFNIQQVPECSTSFVVETLENRVKQLESENVKLKNELDKLRDTTDDKNEKRVRNYLNQLEKANFKINKLHLQIAEKNTECCEQESEIQRLIKEIQRRKEREKMISQENIDLQAELGNAVQKHEELKSEIESLQEKYCEIVDLLNDTQEELKTTRSERVQKANSVNSLYDSLASELEGASDSGFYSTPMVSARSDNRNRSLELASPATGLQLELERLNRNASPIEELESGQQTANNNCEPSTSFEAIGSEALKLDMSSLTEPEFYDLPSKAIVDAVKRSISADERRRARSASHTPQSSTDKTSAKDSRPSFKSISNRGVSLQQTRRPNLEVFDEELPTNEESVVDPQPSTIESKRPASKTYRNASCSPIRVETPPDEPTPRGPCTGNSSVFFPYSGATSYMPHSDATSHLLSSNSPSSTEDEEDSPKSSDSLQNYAGPNFGQPGSPGSRDLEFSLRKMHLYKKLEDDYAKYRKDRNLEPRKWTLRPGGSKPKLARKNDLATLAVGFGAMENSNRPSSLAFGQRKQRSEDTRNNNPQKQLTSGASLCLNNDPARPRTINRSASIGLQLLQHSNQQKHQIPRGIDNAVRERMPLVCGVLWRSIAPRQEQKERAKEEPAKPSANHSELRRQVADLPVVSGSQLCDALGLSPIRQQTDPSPLQMLGNLLKFDHKAPVNSNLTDTLLNGNGLSSILVPTSIQNNSIIQRSSINGRHI